ncbi:cystatin C (amyloid angiopathy and cerebral hemorrhage) [Notolabrus celidotus]|uniref:cystatin C (amyloid angiopathy and cerebral hemorrhage) n=1 Tax=Notolabrus celidotus TaxID=1203425 RepID=UPI0014900946|nr:cystatin C (amyloid angiopathy and cerebral hemorrhage) [Notolabrus celidotus]
MMWKIVLPVLAVLVSVGLSDLVGGPLEINIHEDEGAQSALNFAVVEHNRRSNALFLSKPAEVISTKRQLVAGYLYTITVRMGMTPCRKNNANELCAIHEDPEKARPYECTFTVYTRPWLSETTLKSQVCS